MFMCFTVQKFGVDFIIFLKKALLLTKDCIYSKNSKIVKYYSILFSMWISVQM